MNRRPTGADNWRFLGGPIPFEYPTPPTLFDSEHLREIVGLDANGVPVAWPGLLFGRRAVT